MPPLPAPPARPRHRDPHVPLAPHTAGIVTTIRDTGRPPPSCAHNPRDNLVTTSSPLQQAKQAPRLCCGLRHPCPVCASASDISNSSGSTPAEGAAQPAPDPDLDSMHMMLDPHLRPISPDLSNEESKRIFEEHKQLAQEYLKTQTELAYLSNHKSELEEQMDSDELRQKREVIQLENEKDSLLKLYCTLKKQLARAENESWLLQEDMPHE
ncbi:Mitogen-activated protein kinase kinase kinase 7 [Papilio machaon]|uniref:Mitogen-activated protein kinase kinase kinase 7 n=1 Tax=Papilio machaon TaxID=76193 RepID=A0A194RLJ6_PAPMA|nr:Mitogen-activated protein kinase kinase kinase 7 [Papilio machaon]